MDLLTSIQAIFLLPVFGGSIYALLSAAVVVLFFQRRPLSAASEMAAAPQPACSTWPAVSILKPIYDLEKNLRANLRSACMQDYPTYQLVLSVQRLIVSLEALRITPDSADVYRLDETDEKKPYRVRP